eukprot:Em0023g455a
MGKACPEVISWVDSNGRTLLHTSAISNQCEMMDYLISCGNDLNAVDNNGDTALHLAVTNRHIEATKVLLSHGADDTILNKQSDAPLHIAARNDHGAMVAAMLDYPINVMVTGNRKRTPLHTVAEYDSVEVLKILQNSELIEEKRMVCLRISVKDADYLTPIHLAASKGSHQTLKLLIDWGREHGYTVDKDKLKMVELMVQFGGVDVIACRDAFGQTPLHSSTLPPSTAVLCYLLNIGAQLNACNNQGQTPLITATLSGNLAAVKTLLKSGADPLIKDQNGDNPLHYAVQRNRKAIAKCFLYHPTAPQMLTETNHSGSSPVHCALQQGFSDLVSQMLRLLQEGPLYQERYHTTSPSNCWWTPALCGDPSWSWSNDTQMQLWSHSILLAFLKGHSECAKVLYDAHPFQKNWSNDEGNNALHLAALAGSPACISLALDIGVPITCNNKQDGFLDIIIDRVDSESALAVIQHDRWNECLQFKSPLHPYPMVGLIEKLPDVAKAVLDRCHTKSLLPPDHIDYWESYSFEHLKTDSKSQLMPQSEDMEKNEPDLSITIPTGVQHNRNMHPFNNHLKNPYDVLEKMAELKRGALLSHIVVDSYINQKWREYGCPIFVISLLIAFLQVLFLSIFVKNSFPGNQNVTQNLTINNYLSTSSTAIALITLVFTSLRALWVSLSLIRYGYQVLHINKNLSLWIGGASVLSSYIFLLSAVIRGHEGTLWTAGALAVFFGWFGLALEVSLFDLFGIYVVMFVHITRTLLTVLCLCFLFLLAFGLALYILGAADPNFSTIGYSIFTVSGYILGQINYQQIILDQDNGALSNAPLVFLLIAFGAIILAIAFNNLLVGLAVGDIGKIQKTALVHRQASRIFTFTHLENTMPQCLTKKFNFVDLKVYPNKKLPCLQQLWRHFWRTIKNVSPENDESDSEGPIDHYFEAKHCEKRLLQLNQQVEEMAARQERMLELIQQLHQSKMENTM